jgi:hypothetical protein
VFSGGVRQGFLDGTRMLVLRSRSIRSSAGGWVCKVGGCYPQEPPAPAGTITGEMCVERFSRAKDLSRLGGGEGCAVGLLECDEAAGEL